MKAASKVLLAGLVVAAVLLVAAPKQAEARRWVYYPTVVAAPVVPGPVYSAYYPAYPAYYPVYPRRVVYRRYYAPGYVVPVYPAPYIYGY